MLEVGLGGRLDAVNIVDADCAVVTSVDLDHMDWLGDTRDKIGYEKARIYRSGRPAICADPDAAAKPGRPCRRHRRRPVAVRAGLQLFGRPAAMGLRRPGAAPQRAGLSGPARRQPAAQRRGRPGRAGSAARPPAGAAAGGTATGLLQATLPGRFQILPGQPTVHPGCGHNPHAAAVLAQNLDNMGFHPYTYAVFGMLSDKDVAGVDAGKLARPHRPLVLRRPARPRGGSGEGPGANSVRAALPPPGADDDVPLVMHPCRPRARPMRPRVPRRARMIESWCSDRSSTVAAVLQSLGRKS